MVQANPSRRRLVVFFVILTVPIGIMITGTIQDSPRVVITGYLLTIGVFLGMGLLLKEENKKHGS